MTSATTQTGLTVRTFLLGSGPEADTAKIRQLLSEHDVVSRCGGDLTRLTPSRGEKRPRSNSRRLRRDRST